MDHSFPLEPIELASQDELQHLQLQRLQQTLQHAYAHSPVYRQKFTKHGVHPADCKQLSDLQHFPYTTKEDLRNHYPFGMLAVPREQVRRIHASSGTTGKPTVVAYTAADLEVWATVMARSIRAAGARPGELVHISYGYGLFTGGLGAHYGAEKLGLTVVPFGGGQTEKQVQLILDFQPQIIMVTPSYMLALADELAKQAGSAKGSSLRLGILGAEPWTERLRSTIETYTGIQAMDIYGLSEIIGPGVACECAETQDGPTIWEDHFYPEIIHPHTLQVLPDGCFGELVFTSLTKQALPIIRYRTRDLSQLLPGSARTMRRMAKITGRSDDMMIVRGVNVFPSQIEELILQHPKLTPYYLCILSTDGHLDTLTVAIEVSAGCAPHDPEVEKASESLKHQVKTYIGTSIQVEVRPPGSIERSLGKAKRVLDLRSKN
ncbi:MAG: phenylacetate--CoA ligase [Gammaproteobacteria bacterium]|nr:phenylacetate--CoA ligase [Gammaproteobacteria bacterium]